MNALSFLQALWPEGLGQHWLTLHYQAGKGSPFATEWSQDLDGAASRLEELSRDRDTWIGCGARRERLASGRGGNADVAAIPGLWMEVDLHDAQAHAQDQLPRAAEVPGILDGLPQATLTIHSGHGLHLWWLFREPWEIKEDRAKAESLLKRWQACIRGRAWDQGKWKLDNVADLARVLRAPGTWNRKGQPVQVRLLQDSSIRYNPDELEEYLPVEHRRESAPLTPRASKPRPSGLARDDASLALIERRCSWMAHCKADAASLKEPEWKAQLDVIVRCRDGWGFAHLRSEPHAGYDSEQCEKKITRCMEASPRLCASIRADFPGHCTKCEYDVTTPVSLGYERAPLKAVISSAPSWDDVPPLTEADCPPRLQLVRGGLAQALAREPGVDLEERPEAKKEPEQVPQKPSEPKPWERILTEDDTKVDLRIEPAPIEWLLKDLLPAHVFGATVAQGGVGKTNFWLRLAYHLAAGEPWGPFIPTRPCKVLMLCGEDPPEVIAQRLWTIGRGHYPSNFHVKSVLGSCGPLVEYGNNGNLQPSHWFGWLEKTVEAHKNLDLLIIDPRSRFYGVEENDNDMATQWVSLMEGLQTRRGNATQCTHHIAKAKAGSELSQGMSRGASAFTDGVRLVWAMGEPDEKMVAKRAESDPQLIKFRVVKNNYGPKPKKEFYFEVGEGGLLEPVDPQSEVQMIIQMVIPKALSMVRAPLTRRDILRQDGEAAKAFLEVIRDDVEGATKEDVDRAIKDMLYHRKIFERERPSTGRGPGKKILSLLAQDIGENA